MLCTRETEWKLSQFRSDFYEGEKINGYEEDKDTAKPSDNGNNDNKKETAKNILTGDPVSVFLYTSIMLVSLAIALVCFIYGRKNKKKKIHS